ncbi:hypothetical protein EJ04DRAFT_128977 [Polyplosphaeria fusca]|uniref:Heterokaryon incompatibility domain-containing protein n=1 Tax=Polyplosphaeria fusca TaxID=682080 RepID=A0A9P4QK12_9PLEO|nr:hypothetical protein EJ04DRAFT_128977 [Polyplosphaeria fusca]
MSDIYRQATKVLVWLGPVLSDVVAKAFNMCREIYERNGMYTVPPSNSPIWVPVIALLECSWFRRLWVVQEVVLARSATVFWGDQDIPWVLLTEAICNVMREEVSASSTLPFAVRKSGGCAFRLALFWEGFSHGRGEIRSIFSFLAITRGFDCRDDRDQIYGLLGLITHTTDTPSIEPDYTRKSHQVYED